MIKEILEMKLDRNGKGYYNASDVSFTRTKNTAAVQIGGTVLYFSYDTLVAVTKGVDKYVAINTWGTATGKFLNSIDGGSKEAKEKRVPQKELLRIKI